MRALTTAAVLSGLTTLTAAMALRAADATVAVIAVAAIAVLFTWYAQLGSDDDGSTLDVANPASAAALAVMGRRPWPTLLPVLAAHVVGAVIGGLAALGLDGRLGETLVFTAPPLLVAAVGAALVGVIGAWAALAVDGGAHEGLAAVPALVGGAILPLGLLTVFHPAAVIGLATAGLVPWDVALVASVTTLVAATAGAYAVALVVPQE